MCGTYGPTSQSAFAYYDPDSLCWKTSQGTLDLGSTKCSVTLPPSGSMQSGALSARAPWVPHTHASVCSSWPTPRAHDSNGGGCAPRERGEGNKPIENLKDRVRRLTGCAYPSPALSEYLMGFPDQWTTLTDCEPSETP